MPNHDELRAMAKTILVAPSTGTAWAAEPGRLIPAAYKLASVYLTEHPTDDAKPVTEEWLRTLGAESDGWRCCLVCQGWLIQWYPDTGQLCLQGRQIVEKATRGHVRRLCAALGISLQAMLISVQRID